MDQQTVRPVMPVQSLPHGGRFFFGGRDDDQPEAALRDQRREVAETAALVQVRKAFAGHVIRGATQVDANQFQHAVLFVGAVGASANDGLSQGTSPGPPPWSTRTGVLSQRG